MNSAGVTLLSNAAATGSQLLWPGGQGAFMVAGTFAGATISLQFLGPDNTTWIDAGIATTLNAVGAGLFTLPACPIRASITGGPPSGIYAAAHRIPV